MIGVCWFCFCIDNTLKENHRTDTEYTNNLIIKIFAFYFVNSYTSLFYMAFFKHGASIFGQLEDHCSPHVNATLHVVYETKVDYAISNVCYDQLAYQLISLLATNMLIGQTQEVALPWILGKINLILYKRKLEDRSKIAIWEIEAKKPDCINFSFQWLIII